MAKVESVGIIPYTYDDKGNIVFFAGHPGGNKTNYWSLLKGQRENNEDLIDTALREFKEESGVDLSNYRDDLVYLGKVKQSKVKDVHAFSIMLDNTDSIDPKQCRSNMADGCPWPEIDKYAWKEYYDIISCTHSTHKIFYDIILDSEKY